MFIDPSVSAGNVQQLYMEFTTTFYVMGPGPGNLFVSEKSATIHEQPDWSLTRSLGPKPATRHTS